MSSDARVAREWARVVVESAENVQPVSRGALAAARHVLATTTPPTMGDVEWDDEVHAGLCAEHPKHGLVRMLRLEFAPTGVWAVSDRLTPVLCDLDCLTPIPGTKVDLAPRREPVSNEGVETGNENRNEGVMTGRDHPATLITAEDYENAPEGTIVANDLSDPWVKDSMGFWLVCGEGEGETSRFMGLFARRVLRWGETL